MSGVTLHLGDCLEVMRTMPDNSIDAVITDPPYFKVKDGWWDRQWNSASGFLDWIGQLSEQWQRILKPNGSLYVFASPQMAARVEVKVSEWFNVLNSIVWRKDAGWHKKADKDISRGYFSQTERIIFAEHYGADNIAKGEAGYEAKCDQLRGFVFEPLRAYLDGERERAGVTLEQCNLICGHREQGGMAGRHYFNASQWCLPTADNYAKLRDGFSRLDHGRQYLRREYEDLRREYEDLRRPFSVTADVPYTDVWDFATVPFYPGKHPCEKPAVLLEHIVTVSTRPGAVVLDCFAGSASTLIAAQKLGRSAIGIEIDEKYYKQAQKRITDAQMQLRLDGV